MTHVVVIGSTGHASTYLVPLAQQHEELSDEEMRQLRERASGMAGPNLEDWKKPLRSGTVLHDDV